MFEKICSHCGKVYNTPHRNSKYCSCECSQLARKNRFIKICPICKTKFDVQFSKINQVYCSFKCKSIAQKEKNEIIIENNCAKIKIETEKYGIQLAIIDLEDIDKVCQYKWFVSCPNQRKDIFYVNAAINRKHKISLHRLIMDFPKDLCVHHKNHNPLDNRKENLAICTLKENCQDVISKNNITGYQNIHPYRNGYRVKVTRNYKDYIKRVKTLEEALIAKEEILSII